MRTIKRYSNRKLYDTAESHYVTLAQLAVIIRTGDDIQVLDHDTGRDLTAATMAQIVLEEERGGPRIGPAALRDIIRTRRIP
ncbi:MAG: polyhydroxyalkanoate synthesis regulator DNA-binding domain-containing protein [Phycisphaerae bacterium]|nr:polyhydroxyalkanoate synthesis regulator DNA-binding domain-containing protein [Phycisphaerae bacterium]